MSLNVWELNVLILEASTKLKTQGPKKAPKHLIG